MTKQELIDGVVNYLKGKDIPLSGVEISGRKFSTYMGQFIEWVDGKPIVLCRHSYLNDRARELDWINGYRYGVEYETKGKKPDLPDDLIVEVKILNTRDFGYKNPISELVWCRTTAFRIVDERYNPVESVPEKLWHEKDELPPVGVECEVYNHDLGSNAAWEKCTILWVGKTKCVYESESCYERVVDISGPNYAEFRPLRTEREKFVDSIRQIIYKDANITQGESKELANKLYNAGCRFTEVRK